MRKQYSYAHLWLALTVLFCYSATVAYSQNIITGSFNIRYDNPGDAGNLWIDRAPIVAGLIRFHDFDIIGTQEVLKNQLTYLEQALPEYSHCGVGRDDGKYAGEHAAIFFRKSRFALIANGDFWLSETPEKPSIGWDAKCCKRICAWAKLKDVTTAKTIWVFNVHYDHEGKVARLESSKLLVQRIKMLAGNENVVLTGDFNDVRDSPCYQVITKSGFLTDTYIATAKQNIAENNPTFHGFGKLITEKKVIDHIFVSGNFRVKKWGILTDTYYGKYPSDHFPVLTELIYNE